MSGFGTNGIGDGPQATLGVGAALTGNLLQILNASEIVPGSSPSYELCKVIYTSHPLGAKMAEGPINMAQSQKREISIATGPEERLKEAFNRVWANLGIVGTDAIIHNAMKTSRMYGISSMAMGARGRNISNLLPRDRLHELDLFFNVLDPLNTAGSLVLNQDPNAADYQKPVAVESGGKFWHPANTVVMMNEEPVYIDFTSSAFGFVGRSVYQRALFPLKSYVQTMLTDDMVAYKVGVLVAKVHAQTSNITNRVMGMFGAKRWMVKTATTNNVISVDVDEAIESIDLTRIGPPYQLVRENILKNIATAAGMPARMLDQETMVSGFGEGEEDAKQIARYIDRVRIEMQPLYSFFDDVVQHIAWSPDFFEDLRRDYSEYRGKPYEVVFRQWQNNFQAIWPNLLTEPESEKILVEDVRFKSVVALIEVLAPIFQRSPQNMAALTMWAAEEINGRKELFSNELVLDEAELEQAMQTAEEEAQQMHQSGLVEGRSNPSKEPVVRPFSSTDAQDAVVELRKRIEARKGPRTTHA